MTQVQKERLIMQALSDLALAARVVHSHAVLRDSGGRPFGVIPAASPAGRVLEYLALRREVIEVLLGCHLAPQVYPPSRRVSARRRALTRHSPLAPGSYTAEELRVLTARPHWRKA